MKEIEAKYPSEKEVKEWVVEAVKPYMDDLRRFEAPLNEDARKSMFTMENSLASLRDDLRGFRGDISEVGEKLGKVPSKIEVRDKALAWQWMAIAASFFILGCLTIYFWSAKYEPTMADKRAYESELTETKQQLQLSREQLDKSHKKIDFAKLEVIVPLTEIINELGEKMDSKDYNRIMKRHKNDIDVAADFMEQ